MLKKWLRILMFYHWYWQQVSNVVYLWNRREEKYLLPVSFVIISREKNPKWSIRFQVTHERQLLTLPNSSWSSKNSLAAVYSATVIFSTSLMIPTATVCFMSRMANRPKDGYWSNVSTQMGFSGTILTIAASPDLRHFGRTSMVLSVLRSIFSSNSTNRQGTWAVCQASTAV